MTIAEANRATAERSVMYVYGVARVSHARKSAAPRLDGLVAQAPVRPLVHGNLMAFVSAVPVSQFGASEFRAALADAEWLKGRILAHEKIVEALRARCDVVPFRFGTIYLDSAHVADALARHRTDLCRALDRIQGAAEWGVKLYCDADVLRRRIESESHAMRHLRGEIEHAAPGARFFLQKKYAKALDREAAAMIATSVARIHTGLDACACESAEITVQPAAVHGRSADMVMNAAYLVAGPSLPRFRQTIATLREQSTAAGFDHELTGPWPPYHFVAIRQEGIADAAASDR